MKTLSLAIDEDTSFVNFGPGENIEINNQHFHLFNGLFGSFMPGLILQLQSITID